MNRACAALAMLLVTAGLVRAQDAPPSPPAEQQLEIHLHALSRGYMRPLSATADRVAAMPGFSKVEALGYAGDVLRLRVTTSLSQDAVVAAFGLKRVGGSGLKLVLATAVTDRVKRAEARALILEISRAIAAHPAPDWRNPTKPLLAEAKGFAEQMRTLGLDPAAAEGEFYKSRDFHIEEDHDRYNATYRIWAGKAWAPVMDTDNWRFMGRRGGEAPAKDDRFVGLQVVRSAWQEETRWVDADGSRMNAFTLTRAETDSSGKLKVQDGADWMTKILRRAVAMRVRDPKAELEHMPQGRGWQLFNVLEANELQRWDASQGFDNNCLDMTWQRRDSDKRVIATLKTFHEGHPYFLHAEVDTDAVIEAYTERKEATAGLEQAELGTALKWVVGAESGPEVFVQRRTEARTTMAALLKALGKLPAGRSLADFVGPLTSERATELGITQGFEHFEAQDYLIAAQAFGDVEISVGSPMTGGRWWLLGNAATGRVIRSFQ